MRETLSTKSGEELSVDMASLDEDIKVREHASLMDSTPLLHGYGSIPNHTKGKDQDTVDVHTFTFHDHEKKIKKKRLGCIVHGTTKQLMKHIKVATIFSLTVLCAIIMSMQNEREEGGYACTVSNTMNETLNISDNTMESDSGYIQIIARGAFEDPNRMASRYNVTIQVVRAGGEPIPSAHPWVLPISKDITLEGGEPAQFKEMFPLERTSIHDKYQMIITSNTEQTVGFMASYVGLPKSVENQVIYAAIILVGVYVLIVFDLVHRTLAAMIGAMAALATLSAMNQRPSLEYIMKWIDYETLALLWGMMTMVAIFADTGVFDWSALMAYKLAKGRVWVLITILCLFTGCISAFLDNVTTILLITPVTIRLCEVLNLDPIWVLIALVLFSNIGGTATAVGDPPNVIIVSNKEIQEAGINFAEFTLHMFIGVIFCMIGGFLLLRLMYSRMTLENTEPQDIIELKREIEIWKRSAARIQPTTREESMVKALLLQKVVTLEHELTIELNNRKQKSTDVDPDWREKLAELELKYKITDPVLLIKSSIVLGITVLLFFTYSFLPIDLNLGWISIIGALMMLIIADILHLETIFERIEWATLLFFAGLFVLMEGLAYLGLIDWIGDRVSELIASVPREHQLMVAIITIVWVSAIVSSFIDNIPFTTAMIPIVINVSVSNVLPLKPLVWSLAFGACLGGNGTLIGASANVVCAGIAEQHGYTITFNQFFKVGFPMMLVTTFIAMIYLLICHVAFDWNY
ncbi:P protein-like [Saccoglossus kowalevskii]|uniref:P protein-like n=1 Tax=Saccoglossus kowalevskii TaxID=10224 RepID=A0ABM0LXG6_SACKO|nr:PREDICTED: P protein-like [Saccoglossus kowalevskii]